MSFEIVPPGGPAGSNPYDATAKPAQPAKGVTFARVYELEEARRRREIPLPPIAGDRIPDEVWQEVDHAARLVEALHAEGKRMMFDTDRLTGRVVASLIGTTGEAKPVALTDAVNPGAAAYAASTPPSGPAVA